MRRYGRLLFLFPDNVIVHYHMETGSELDRIVMGPEDPFFHGLSIWDYELWFADINFAG